MPFTIWERFRSSCCLQIIFIFLVGIGAMLGHQPGDQPILDDRAYLIYMAQGISRGEPIYQTTTFGYTPLGVLLSSAVMSVGGLLDVPSYLAPRFVSVPLFALTGVLLYLIAREMTGSRWLGLWAGLLNFSIEQMLVFNASNLEPKLLVQVFTLLMIFSIQQGAWLTAGICVSSAALCWQPAAAILVAPLLITLYIWYRGHPKAFMRFASGLTLGLLPSALYLTLTNQWFEFLYQGFSLKLLTRPIIAHMNSWAWFRTVILLNLKGLTNLLLPLSALGLAAYVWQHPLRSYKKSQRFSILAPRSGGLFLLTLSAVAYSTLANVGSLELQGHADLIPYHYLLAFWSALGLLTIFNLLSSRFSHSSTMIRVVYPSFITACIVFGLASDSFNYHIAYPLSVEQARLRLLLSDNPATSSWLSINAVELYVLTEKLSPWPVIMFGTTFNAYIEHRFSGGCQAFLRDLETQHYSRVVINPFVDHNCLQQIAEWLQDRSGEFEALLFVDNQLRVSSFENID